jgi:tRNA threonylcarbamoyladenosine biosynthesis protein TsaB
VNILALDTSTEYCSAALWRLGEVRQRIVLAGQRHSELLLPMVEALLEEGDVGVRQLDAVAAAVGPGSFTGLRIAAAVGQGIAFGAGLPTVPVGTLEAMAASADARDVVVCIDARMDQIYGAVYRRRAEFLEVVVPPFVASPEDLPALPPGDWTGRGNAFARFAERIRGAWGHAVARVEAEAHPEARWVAALAAQRLARGAGQPPEALTPIYVRDKVALTAAER